MSINTEIKTGNPIVDEVGMLNLSGNVIPETWYQTIISDKGKVNCLAILVLSDIVYWYRPQECRNEGDLSVRYVKRFHDDEYLQRSYEQICSKFNISKKQARDSIVFLESLGVIKRHRIPFVIGDRLIPDRNNRLLPGEILQEAVVQSVIKGRACNDFHDPRFRRYIQETHFG